MNEELVFLAELWLPPGDPVQVSPRVQYPRRECVKALVLGTTHADFGDSGTWHRFTRTIMPVGKPRAMRWLDYLTWLSDLKYCKNCNTVKDIEDFYKDRGTVLGRLHECKICAAKREKNRRNGAYKSSLYRARKSKACPNWVNLKQLAKIYADRPDGMEVDHIVPIAGKLVSGLHVPWNLQYLSREDNAMKSNKF